MKVWVTVYALTTGIQEFEVEQSKLSPSMVTTKTTYMQAFHGEGKDWHRTKAEAIERAEKMKLAKILSIKKQIKKLEELRFN